MNSNLLIRAREYEAEHLAKVPEGVLPRFHLTAGSGWLNDPNGFSFYQGAYHLFYQYNPYSTHWDTMHWGHVKSHDLIRWERLPCVLAPDEDYDKDGCYSGSAIELPDGRHLLMYTAVRKLDNGKEVQTQCAAIGNGIDYEKYEGNPVIPSELLPEGNSTEHFRDPFIWKEDGIYYAVMGNLGADDSGMVLLYKSEDALHWSFVSIVTSSEKRFGRMWECPNFFHLDGKDVLLVSPQEMKDGGKEYIDGNTTLCMIGTMKPDGTLLREHEQTIDYGLDFYAPQTIETVDGRRVIIGWMQYWNGIQVHPRNDLPFFGQMTLPRELHIKHGRLYQNPIRELEQYRADQITHNSVPVNGQLSLPDIKGRSLDLTVRIRSDKDNPYRSFTVTVAKGPNDATSFTYHPETNEIFVDRSKSGWSSSVLNQRTFPVSDNSKEITLRFILDRYSVELFVNEGEQAASFVIFSPEDADAILFEADGNALIDVEQYTLRIDDPS